MCNETFEKVRNIVKTKFNSELIYTKEYLKAEKEKFITKKSTQKNALDVFIYQRY